MVNVYVSGVSIDIGRQLENEAREIYFDLSGLEETYGQGTATLVHLRPSDAAPYICTTRVYGQYLVWTVTNTDTAYSGAGKCELRWVVGETLAKSIIYTTTIAPSITGAEEVPSPYQSWYEALLENINEYIIASDQIETNAENIAENTENLTILTGRVDEMSTLYVTPEMFGAVGDGTTDDTEAMKLCFNFAKNIIFVPDKVYLISDTLTLRSGHHIDFNGAKIISTTAHLFFNFDTTGVYTEYDGWGNITLKNGTIIGGAISLFHAQNVLIDAMHFENCINDHFIEICACKDVTISNSRFTGMLYIAQSQLEYINIDPCAYSPFPHLNDPENSSYDGTPCKNLMIHDNIFKIGEGNYAYMTNGVGTHQAPSDLPLHENVQINDNVVSGSSNSAISLLGCTKSGAVGNRVSTVQSPFRVGYGDSNIIFGNTAEVSSLVALVNFWYPTTNVVIYENNIINSSGYDSSGWAIITGNIDGSTFNKLQEHYVAYAGGTEYTLPFNIGVFNKLILDFGSVGAGTYFKQTIGSFSGRGFQNGEVFPFFDYDTNSIRKQQIAISGNKITSSVSLRNVYVAADFTKKFS